MWTRVVTMDVINSGWSEKLATTKLSVFLFSLFVRFTAKVLNFMHNKMMNIDIACYKCIDYLNPTCSILTLLLHLNFIKENSQHH